MNYVLKLCLLVTLILSSAAFAVAQEASPKPATEPQTEAKAQEAQPEAATNVAPTAETKPSEPVAPTGPKPTIYFYRIKQFAGSSLEPTVYCDEKELARMDNGRYFGVTLSPGKHVCRMGDKQTGFEIDVKGDETYYGKVSIEAGFWKGHGRLTLVQPEQGGFELKKVKLLSVTKVKDRELVTLHEGSENQ